MLFGAGPVRCVSNVATSRAGESRRRLLVSDMDILHAAVRRLGIGLLPAFLCVEDLRARRFERVLRDWKAPSTPVHVVYPSTRHLSPKVKSFVDHPGTHDAAAVGARTEAVRTIRQGAAADQRRGGEKFQAVRSRAS